MMGRSSRRKAELKTGLRLPSERESRRQAFKAERRGRRVNADLPSYERLCDQAPHRLIEALIARHNVRMQQIVDTPYWFRRSALECLAAIAPLDGALLHSGMDPMKPPSSYGDEWVSHLGWAVDSAVAAIRLLLCGQVLGAASVARSQLERWLMHRAYNARLLKSEGESTDDFVARVWSAEDGLHRDSVTSYPREQAGSGDEVFSLAEPVFEHKHVTGLRGEEICPSIVYQHLSEMMHVRIAIGAIAWDADSLLRGEVPEELQSAVRTVCGAVVLSLRQVRVALATMALENGDRRLATLLADPMDSFSFPMPSDADGPASGGVEETEAPSLAPVPLLSLAPLTPREGLRDDVVEQAERAASNYISVVRYGKRPAGHLYRDDELVVLSILWRRSRAARTALTGLERERVMLGDDFDERGLEDRSQRWILITEAASLFSVFAPNQEIRAASAAVGSGLRSAYWLWLEDDDRALSVLRCVLEQAARIRCWRKKPNKARRLEGRPQTTARDWIAESGWRRLAALNNSLGEFAHFTPNSRFRGARELLQQLHPDIDSELAPYLARGVSIDFVSHLAISEICLSMESVSSKLRARFSALFDDLGLETSDEAEYFERLFHHMWGLRGSSLGASDFVGPAVDFWNQPGGTDSSGDPR